MSRGLVTRGHCYVRTLLTPVDESKVKNIVVVGSSMLNPTKFSFEVEALSKIMLNVLLGCTPNACYGNLDAFASTISVSFMLMKSFSFHPPLKVADFV